MTIYSGFSHWKWWFSIAMLVYQRVHDGWLVNFLGTYAKSSGFLEPTPEETWSWSQPGSNHTWSENMIDGWRQGRCETATTMTTMEVGICWKKHTYFSELQWNAGELENLVWVWQNISGTRFDEAWDGSKIHDLMPTFSFVCFSYVSLYVFLYFLIQIYIYNYTVYVNEQR